ncbi:MAG: DUF192 domain-containing protein [Actinomycetota bacterium]|nr:DUF192 domain-containing protein [Actinomycetota bacterium]
MTARGEPVAEAEVATSLRARSRGLLGRRSVEGVLVLRPAKSVHTLGMNFPIDVAFCDRDGRILSVVTMRTWRVGRPRLASTFVVEAKGGSFSAWGLAKGDTLSFQKLGTEPH